jgi:phenol 2-monooxygenase
VDSVVTTTFPDIRKRCAIHSPAGSIMVIPRERISGSQVLTRIYCQMEDDVEQDPTLSSATATTVSVPTPSTPSFSSTAKESAKARRSKISLDRITSQTQKVLAPYTISFSTVDWWAAYQIGQRATTSFSAFSNRVHIAGDACHTHSPKAGQGMNVSMMDAFNLSWKLAHVILGLAPSALLDTYNDERLDIARQLIEFDTKFSSMFSGKMGAGQDEGGGGLTHEEFLKVFRTGGGFTSGCGIEYKPSCLVFPEFREEAVVGGGGDAKPRELGTLVPGRRVMSLLLRRFADANPRHVHDDMPSIGVYRVLLVLPKAFREDTRRFWGVVRKCVVEIPGRFVQGVLQTLVIFRGKREGLEWDDFTGGDVEVMRMVEWGVFGDEAGGVEEVWGVGEEGAVVGVRPDGYVGVVAGFEEGEVVGKWLEGVLVGA